MDIFEAIHKNDISMCINLIASGVDVNVIDADKLTPLDWAIIYKHKHIAKLLMPIVKKPINAMDVATQANAVGFYSKILVEFKIDINALDLYGWTILYHAIYLENEKCVKFLLENGANPNVTIRHLYYTCLNKAVSSEKTEIIELLLQHGADPNGFIFDDWTPLHFAICRGREDLFNLLLKYKVDIYSINGASLIYRAIDNKHLDMIPILLKQQIDINKIYDPYGSPMHMIHWIGDKNKMLEISKILVEYGANLDLPDHNLMTPLMFALKEDSVDYVEVLLKFGANPNILTNETALHIAMKCNKMNQFVPLLLKYGADPNIANSNGETPIFALSKCDVKITQLLIDHGANINAVRGDGKNVMQHFWGNNLKFDSLKILQNCFKKTKKVIHFLLLAREYDENSLVSAEYLCLDLFKVIARML